MVRDHCIYLRPQISPLILKKQLMACERAHLIPGNLMRGLICGLKCSVLNGQKLFCYMSNPQAPLVHCASGRVLCMPDPHSLYLMNPDTAQRIGCIHVMPQHAAQQEGSLHIGNLAWSSHGEMLALSLLTSRSAHKGNASIIGSDSFISCMVHISNAVTGQPLAPV